MSQPIPTQRASTDRRPEVRGHHLDTVIGQGGSSTVWRGRDAGGHPVAVKVPHEHPDPVALEQATIERHVLMAVEHEHLVGLRDVVPLDDGRVALVFDLVSGVLLSGLVHRRGHLRTGEVVTVLTPLCAAVRALHMAGGTHGDISPGNVMVTEAGVPMLLDLGASRVIAAAPGARFGTPGFMAPEVRRGASADARSDVFSLGALAWFCATGNGAPDTDQRLDPDTISSHVGHELAGVVTACIDPDPARRPDGQALARLFYDVTRAEAVEVVLGADDAAALTHRLREQAAGEQPEPEARSRWQALRARLVRRPEVDGPVVVEPSDAAQSGSCRSRPLLVALLAVAAVLGVVAVSSAVVNRSNASTGSTTATPSLRTPTAPPVADGRLVGSAGAVTATGRPRALPSHQRESARPVSKAGARSNRRAPATQTVGLVDELTRYRTQALMRRERPLLAQVHRPGSASWKADDRVIATLVERGLTWQSLRASVASARLVKQNGDHAVIRAQVQWAGYDVVSATGERTTRVADPSSPLDLTVVWGPGGWRLSAVSDPPTR